MRVSYSRTIRTPIDTGASGHLITFMHTCTQGCPTHMPHNMSMSYIHECCLWNPRTLDVARLVRKEIIRHLDVGKLWFWLWCHWCMHHDALLVAHRLPALPIYTALILAVEPSIAGAKRPGDVTRQTTNQASVRHSSLAQLYSRTSKMQTSSRGILMKGLCLSCSRATLADEGL